MQRLFVGDVQGCSDELNELLERAEKKYGDEFELWQVGDLVNRGPGNLRVLERVRSLDEQGRAHCVLGNHETALLEVAFGLRSLRPEDTYGDVLESSEADDWINQTWTFAKQIAPLLLVGVLVAGFLLGRPGEQGLIPGEWVAGLVGGNSIRANLAASVLGAFMYFATLTEVPILQGLIGAGMGKGPALALLLAGPALSLPNMLVIRSIMGTQKTAVFVSLVIVMATLSGMIYGWLF